MLAKEVPDNHFRHIWDSKFISSHVTQASAGASRQSRKFLFSLFMCAFLTFLIVSCGTVVTVVTLGMLAGFQVLVQALSG